MNARIKGSVTHEFAHMVHGEYFYQMSGIDVGFAEFHQNLQLSPTKIKVDKER